MHIPDGFNTIAPCLIVEDGNALIDFPKSAFDAIEIGRSAVGGRIMNAQIRIGDSTLMIGETNEQIKPTLGSYYQFVENADESMRKAIDAGGELVMEVANMPCGDRQGGVNDPSGNTWWVSQRLIDEPYQFD